MVEVAQAYVTLIPSFKGVKKEIDRELGTVDGKSGEQAGEKTRQGFLSRVADTAIGVTMGNLAAKGIESVFNNTIGLVGKVGGAMLSGGFERSLNLEASKKKLEGLGHSAEAVTGITNDALAAVQGTAFGLGEASTVAASLVAANIKPGKELEDSLRLVADASTVAGTSMDSMGLIFGKVAASDRVTLGVINQLHTAGIPALQAIATEYGVTADEASKMVSRGDVDFAHFQSAMETTLGGTAKTMGETFSGSYANMGAALSRLGEDIISGPFSAMPGIFGGITATLDTLGPVAENIGGVLGGLVERLTPFIDGIVKQIAMFLQGAFTEGSPMMEMINNLGDSIVKVASSIMQVMPSVMEIVFSLVDVLGSALADVLPIIVDLIASLVDAVSDILPVLLPVIKDGVKALADLLGGTLQALLPGIVAVIESIAPILQALLPPLLDIVNAILPPLTDLLVSVAGTISDALIALLPSIVNLVLTLANAFEQLLPILLPLITKGIEVIADLLSGPAFQQVLTMVINLVSVLADAFSALLPAIMPIVSALITSLVPIIMKMVPIIEMLLPLLMDIVMAILPPILDLIIALMPAVLPLISMLGEVLTPVIQVLGDILGWLIDLVSSVLQWFLDLVGGTDNVGKSFDAVKDTIGRAWDAIVNAVKTAWNWIDTNVFGPIKDGIAAVGRGFESAKDAIGTAFNAIKDGLKVAWDWIDTHVFSIFRNGIDAIVKAFESAKDSIGTAWDMLKEIAAKPINFIIKTVYMDGIKATFDKIAGAVGLSLKLPTVNEIKFASGGVMPGYTPGRDVHQFVSPTGGRLALSGGEAIMRPEFTRAVGGAAGVAALNAMARNGSLGTQRFADGGVWGWIKNAASNVGDFVSKTAENIKDAVINTAAFLANPVEGFKRLLSDPVSAILKTIGVDGQFADSLVEVPPKIIESLIDKAVALIKSIGSSGADTDSDIPPGLTASGWTKPSRGRMTSPFGPRKLVGNSFHNGTDFAGGGATFAASGGRVSKVGWNVGYGNTGIGIMLSHGGGLETYYGHNPSLDAVRVRVGDIVTPGQHIGQEGATGNVTGVHLHWSAFRNGKAFNPMTLLDDGGYLQPGITIVENRTGAPEPVFTQGQWANVSEAIANNGKDSIDYERLARAVAEATMEASDRIVMASMSGRDRSSANTRTTRGIVY